MSGLNEKGRPSMKMGASLGMRAQISELMGDEFISFKGLFVLRDRTGKLKWEAYFHNVITTPGKNDLLDKYFAGSAYTAAFKLGLKGVGTAVNTDTLASHSSWTEITAYSGNRPSISWSAASAGSKAGTATYTMNGIATIAGGFITDQATGTAGLLYSAGDFTGGNRGPTASGDTLSVTLAVGV